MGNELGNQNSTEAKGEEDEAIQGKENFQPAKDGVNGENHIIPEGESKDYHHKADLPACLSPDPEVPETELDKEEPQNLDKVLERHVQDEKLRGQDDPTIKKEAQGDEHNSETCLHNGEARTKADDIKVPEEKPSLSEKDEEFETYESNIISRQESEGENNSPERESEVIQEMSSTGNTEETGLLIDTGHGVNSLIENEDFHGKRRGDDTEQETIFTSNNHEKYDDSVDDIAGRTNIRTEEIGDFLPLVKLTDSTESTLDNEKPEDLNPLIDHSNLTNCEPAVAERNHDIREIEKVAYSVPISESSQVAEEGGKEVEINSKEVENEAFLTENVTVGDRIPNEQISQSQLYGEGNILIVTGEELELKHQIPLKISSETDIIPDMPNSQFGNGEMNAFESSISEVPEINGRSSIQSNPELPCNRIELTKCPSFDFGIPLDARSEESDQTPFLQPRKSIFRSLSISSKTANDRHSLDYESIVVGEKTIRVERSDSCNSSASLHILRKEENNNAEVFSRRNESNGSNMNGEYDSARSMKVELDSSSPFNTGTRKTRSSFFSTCLCCSTAIN